MSHVLAYGQSPHTTNWVWLHNLKDVLPGEIVSPIKNHSPLTYKRLQQEINCALVLSDQPDSAGRYLVMDGGLLRFRSTAIVPEEGIYKVGYNVVLCQYDPPDGSVSRILPVPAGTDTSDTISWVDYASGTIGLCTGIDYRPGSDIPEAVHFLLKLRR